MSNPDKPRKKSNEHEYTYRKAGEQFDNAAREVAKGIFAEQGAVETTANVAAAVTKGIGLGLQGVSQEILSDLTAPPKPKKKKKKRRNLARNKARTLEQFARQCKPFVASEEAKAKFADDYRDPGFREGIERSKRDIAKVFEESQRVQQEALEAEWAAKAKLQKKPEPFSTDADERGFKRFKCQYKSCQQEFFVPHSQLDWYNERNFHEPKACNSCRLKRWEILNQDEVTQACDACGKPVTLNAKFWHNELKDQENPKVSDHCSCFEERRRKQIQVDRDKQLVVIQDKYGNYSDLKGGQKELAKMDLVLNGDYKKRKGELRDTKDKRQQLHARKTYFKNMLESGNHHIPLTDLGEADIDYYKRTLKENGKETVYEHIESHFTGVRKIDGKFTDASLREDFNSVEDAINYAHYIASVHNPQQFVDLHYEGDNPTRYDLVKGLVIVYTKSTPRHIVTMYKPNHPSSVDDPNDLPPDELKIINHIFGKIEKAQGKVIR